MLTRPRQAILDALGSGEWLYGQQIVERSGGRLSRGTVYVHLALLEEEGIIESMREGLPLEDHLMGCLPRPLFRLVSGNHESERDLKIRDALDKGRKDMERAQSARRGRRRA